MKRSAILSRDQRFGAGLVVVPALSAQALWMPLWLSSTLLAVSLLLLVQVFRDWKPLPAPLRLLLIFALIGLVVAEYGFLFGRQPGGALLAGMLAIKLSETRTRRDGLALVSLATFLAIVTFLFETGITATFLVLVSFGLAAYGLEQLQPSRIDDARSMFRRARTVLLLLSLALPPTVAAFVLFPRLTSPLWGTQRLVDQPRTGVSDQMEPGSDVDLYVDDAPAFRVRFMDRTPDARELYWRGPVLNQFDGRTWTTGWSSLNATGNLPSVPAGSDFPHEVTLEPTERRWLFVLDRPTRIPSFATLSYDLQVRVRRPQMSLLRYEASGAPHAPVSVTLSPYRQDLSLGLPASMNPRTHELADAWSSERLSDRQIVERALAMFNQEAFAYTLDAPLLGRDSVDDFLFGTRRGFCEHYASSFTYLMRAAGVPARVVTGYMGGQFNRIGEYWLVRQADAHAWSEVWLVGEGWVRIDPTAAVAPERIDPRAMMALGGDSFFGEDSWLGDFRARMDYLRAVWNQIFIEFDAAKQSELFKPLGIQNTSLRSLLMTFGILVILAMAIAAFVLLRHRSVPRDVPRILLDLLTHRLARAGCRREDSESWSSWAKRARGRVADSRSFDALLETLLNWRYAGAEGDPKDLRRRIRSIQLQAR